MPVLEQLTPAMCSNVNKLVFEYSFDVDRSIPRFLAIVKRLEACFATVHWTGQDQVRSVETWPKEWYPMAKNVFCMRVATTVPTTTTPTIVSTTTTAPTTTAPAPSPAPIVVVSSTGSGELITLAPTSPAVPQPQQYTTHNVHNIIVEFDAYRLLHKNTLHTTGNRYAAVFFNVDMDFKGRSLDARSVAIKASGETPVRYVQVNSGELVDFTRTKLVVKLNDSSFSADNTSGRGKNHIKYGSNKAYKRSFGKVKSRKKKEAGNTKAETAINNAHHNSLYDHLCQYMEVFAPGMFSTSDPTATYNTLIITKNAQCVWHTDGRNSGPATLMALGDFEGGGRFLIQTVASSSSAGM